ncbi:hypothetical protein D3C87_1823370 [compost metagenome]
MKLSIKKWVLTPHAVERVVDRKITIPELELLIREPDTVIAQGPKYLLVKKLKGRKDNNVAAVVLEKREQDLWVVITVMVNFQKK